MCVYVERDRRERDKKVEGKKGESEIKQGKGGQKKNDI